MRELRTSHIGEMFGALLPFVVVGGCQEMPGGRGAVMVTGTLDVRVRGIAPEVDAVEFDAGVRQERVVLSMPTGELNTVMSEMPPGRATVVVRGVRGSTTVQTTTVEVIVRKAVISVLSVDLGFPHRGVDGGMSVPGDAGGGIQSDLIVLSFDGQRDFSFGAPGVLRGSTAGDPTGAYQAFLRRAATELGVSGAAIGISRVEMRFRGPDDVVLEDIYRGFSLLIEGVTTSTLASHRALDGTKDWFLLCPSADISVAQPDLRRGDFRVTLTGRTTLDRPVFVGVLDARMTFDVR